MFYRQKVLLALIQLCGGKVSSTDLEKLLFLFCQSTKENHYDFFSYKYGAFSFISYYDKRKLIEKGVLKDTDQFELITSTSYVDKLQSKDRVALRSFVYRIAKFQGQALLRKSYLEYPHYASRSEIAETILSEEEYNEVSSFWKLETKDTLFTIGYEGSSIDQYLCRLLTNNVKALIDVRMNPVSRKHGFSQNDLRAYVEKVGIQYYHLPELGITSHLRKNLKGKQSYEELFEYYASITLPAQTASLDKIRQLLFQYRRVALTCFEADYQMCHRHKIAELFELDATLGIPVIHI